MTIGYNSIFGAEVSLGNDISGTVNQVTVTDDGDGTITISTPQDLDSGVDFAVGSLTSSGKVDASAGEVLVEDNDTSEPTSKDDGYVGVATVGGTSRIYFAIGGTMYYVDGTAAAVPATGNPIGIIPINITYS